jgi:hypothetical protein
MPGCEVKPLGGRRDVKVMIHHLNDITKLL